MIEVTVFLAIVMVLAGVTVKFYEWSQDVLHGPYVDPRSEAKHFGQE